MLMKRISTLTSLLVLVLCAISAQEGSKSLKLEHNRVIYLTCDTMTVDPAYPEDTLYWNVDQLHNPFNFAGMALNGHDATDWNYQVAFRKDYTDPETGFTLQKGYYRGITLMEATLGLYGTYVALDGQEYDYSAGIKNLKKAILYFVPLPNAKCATYGYNYNHDRLPSNGGRIEAQYMNDDGTPLSNNAYRDPSIGTTLISGGTPDPEAADGWTWDEYYYTLTDCPLNYSALQDDKFLTGYNAALVTIDQPFKLSVDLTNPLRGSKYDGQWESDTKKSDFAKLPIDGLTELILNGDNGNAYYFADVTDCPSSENRESSPSSSGYNMADNKWGKKVNWSADTPIKIGIKRRLYLVGIGLVCGTDGATTEYLNAGDYNDWTPQFTTEKKVAFGNIVSGDMPDDPWADRRMGNMGQHESAIRNINANTDLRQDIYNLQGVRVNATRPGLYIQQGKKFVVK